jgi:divalent metal cation (Fe/Co/Zn/Cd) transporter
MLIGLGILHFTKIVWIDSVVALIFGTIILLTGVGILRETIAHLTDEADPQTLQKILEIVASNRVPEWIDIHNLKITKYGRNYYIDCDLTLPMYFTISEGHGAYRRFKNLLQKEFSEHTSFSVHFDSCEQKYCKNCNMHDCPVRREDFVKLKPCTIQHITSVVRHS